MSDFIHLIFNGANALPTALLLFVVLYWIIVIFGFISSDFFEIELDLETEANADLEIDGDGVAVSWINNVLQFFNLGKIPLMIWLSFVALPLWMLAVNLNSLLGFESFLPGLIIFLPAAFISLFLAKFLTWPFVKVFEKLDADTKSKEIIGRVGTVTSSASSSSRGMAEINYDGSFLRILIKCSEGQAVQKGEQVLFIKKLNQQGVYLVEPYLSID